MEQPNEILKKYQEMLSPILQIFPEAIKIEVCPVKEWYSIAKDYYKKEELETDWSLGKYRVMFNNILISSWTLYQLPNCCAYVVSCNVHVDKTFRNKGVGTILNNLRQDIGRYLGYSAILCTDITTNEPQNRILQKNGWTGIHQIKNKRTGNTITLCVKNLNE